MGMYGDKDIVVSPQPVAAAAGRRPACPHRALPDAGHFIMLDEPQRFIETLINFLEDEAAAQ